MLTKRPTNVAQRLTGPPSRPKLMLLLQRQAGSTHLRARISSQGLEASVTRSAITTAVRADKQNWVAWTPEGFYGATTGAFGVLQWQVNHGFDAAADTVPVSAIPSPQA